MAKRWTPFYLRNEGGRSTSSHPNETNDCAVAAISIAFGMSYDESHTLLEKHGRKPRRGTRFFKVFLKTKLPEYDIEVVDFNMTVFQFMKNKPIGTYVISTRTHAFCVKDGVINDNFLIGAKSKIIFFAKIRGKKLTNPPEVTTL